jgi:hypothetical protein
MLVRIDDFDSGKTPHKLVFPDFERIRQAQGLRQITAWQTESHDELPAMAVRIGNAPAHGTVREIPDDFIQLELRPYPGGHPSLNAVLVFNGLNNALADLNIVSAERRADGRGSELATRVTTQVAPG